MDSLEQVIRLVRELDASTRREHTARAGLKALRRTKGCAALKARLELNAAAEVARREAIRAKLEELRGVG